MYICSTPLLHLQIIYNLYLIAQQVLYWLSGLTCTDENFIIKSGAQRAASNEGIALIAPDTSPSKSMLGSFILALLHQLDH